MREPSDPPPGDDAHEPSALEREIRELFVRRDFEQAVTCAIEGYGPEVLGFLIATAGDEQEADEVFSELGEDLWRGIESFSWRSSFRTWMYTLARNACHRHRRAAHRRPGRHVGVSFISELAVRVRSRTLPHLRTEVKDQFAVIRESLDPDDRELLVLRIDRRMSWDEIAEVMAGDDALDRARVAARLRKRFQSLKDELREKAQSAGLLDEE